MTEFEFYAPGDCTLCDVANGRAPARVVAESETTVAVFPLRMITPGHTIIVPKYHWKDFFSISSLELVYTLNLARDVAELMRDNLGATGVNLIQNNGISAKQTEFHFHIHVVPRWDNDRMERLWVPSQEHDDEALDRFLADLTGTRQASPVAS